MVIERIAISRVLITGQSQQQPAEGKVSIYLTSRGENTYFSDILKVNRRRRFS